MKIKQPRYQRGSIRKVPHANKQYSWEFKYYSTGPDGKRKAVSQAFSGLLYKTQRDVRKAVEGQMQALNANTLALGRRNWTHVGHVKAGPRVAAILSIVETCRRMHIPVRQYLAAVLPGPANTSIQRLPGLTPTA